MFWLESQPFKWLRIRTTIARVCTPIIIARKMDEVKFSILFWSVYHGRVTPMVVVVVVVAVAGLVVVVVVL